MKTIRLMLTGLVLVCVWPLMAQQRMPYKNVLRETDPAFFQTEEARRVGEQVLLYQRVTGGWPKNVNMVKPLNDQERAEVQKDKQRQDDSTTDNGATNMQLTYLARLYQATGEQRIEMHSAKVSTICSADSMKMADGRSSGRIRRAIRCISRTTTVRW